VSLLLINRSSQYRFSVCAVSLVGAMAFLAGCGGGGNRLPTSSGGELVTAKVPISWALRAREIGGPSSALSAVVTFDLAGATNQNVTLEADRSAAPAPYRQTYLTSQTVKAGVTSIHARFYSLSGAQGSLVAQADASVLVKPDGTLAKVDGSPLGAIGAQGQVTAVSISGPQSVSLATPQLASVNVFDAQNNLLAVSSGSVFFTVANGTGAATIAANGEITGTAAGTVTLTATVDGISSLPTPITVLPPPVAVTSLVQPTSALTISPKTGNIWATVPPTDSKYGNSVIEIDQTTHKIVSSITVGSSPTVMAFSDDGSALYIGLQGADSYASVDPIGKKLLTTYPLSSTGFGGSQHATCIAVQPGHPNVVALCQQDDADTGFTSGCIYNNGLLLPSNMGVYDGEVLGFSSAATLWGSDPGFSPQSLFRGTVDLTGATLTSENRDLGGSFSVFRGNLYFTNGEVVSGASGNLQGTYPVQPYGRGVVVDFSTQTSYSLEQTQYNGSYLIEAFGATNFKSLTTYSIPNGPGSIHGFSLLQPGQFVFADETNVYFAQLPSNRSANDRRNHAKK